MNADNRRWKLAASLLIAAAIASATHDAKAAEVKFQLEEDVNRRFSVKDEVPNPGRIIDSTFRLTRTLRRPGFRPLILDFSQPQAPVRDEEPDPLPQPTLVELRIAKGFPSGERAKVAERDDSYHLAEEDFTFGGIRFSR